MYDTNDEGIDVSSFLGGKLDLARTLARGECGGRYEDAILILSSVVGTFSAQLWPTLPADVPKKKRVPDNKRFIEFWVTYGDPAAVKISVPLLAETLYLSGEADTLRALKSLRPELLRHFPETVDGDVYTGDTADASEAEVISSCSKLTPGEVRRWSYPAVFYREVRSGYVHELNPTDRASRFPALQGRHGAAVTYLNSVIRPFRRIHFDIEWLCATIETLARRAYPDWQRNGSRCARKWWIDGA